MTLLTLALPFGRADTIRRLEAIIPAKFEAA